MTRHATASVSLSAHGSAVSTVGLPESGAKRRGKGLRREEVAPFASISPDCYTRIEQGRTQASAPGARRPGAGAAFWTTANANTCSSSPEGCRTVTRQNAQKVSPQLLRVLDQPTSSPALVLGRQMDILSWNRTASALLADFSAIAKMKRNSVWLMFSDPAIRALHVEWEAMARTAVAMLRMEAGRSPHGQRMPVLVGELSMKDDDFRTMVGRSSRHRPRTGQQDAPPPCRGEPMLDWDALTCTSGPEQQLVV
ncbi:transcriptional regulator [Amycolatopsis japonica]|uniref:MmyB family transcriptional regulator n=1 Tax=Amycolatopsis japonica TaxID=208439 RepID=UPI00331C1572